MQKAWYIPQAERAGRICADSYAQARSIAAWKAGILDRWNSMEVVSFTRPDDSYVLSPENALNSEVVLNTAGIDPEDIGVEILFTENGKDGKLHIMDKFEYELVGFSDGVATFRASIFPERTGMYQVATRIYPKNPALPHRQDFPLVKWL